MKTLKILFIAALILFPFGEILRFDVGNNIVIKPLDAIVGLIALWWVFTLKAKHPLIKPALIFSLLGLLSLVLNSLWLKIPEFFVALLYLVRWISYAFIVCAVAQFSKSFKKVLIFFLFIDGLIIVVLGYIQYFFYSNLRNLYYLGWDEHMHRMFSTFFDPNFAGAFFVLYFLFLLGIIQFHLKKKKRKEVFILTIILGVTLVAIFLTFSRAALLMLIVGAITYFTLLGKKKFIVIVLGAVVLFGIVASPKFYDENMNLFREASSKARLDNYATALKIIQDRPLFGVGFNTYRYAKVSYGVSEEWTKIPSHADAGVDNSFLFVLATTGIVGLCAYLFLWYSIVKKAYFLYKKSRGVFAGLVFSSTIALFVNALFINSLFFAPFMFWMWTLIGLMEDY